MDYPFQSCSRKLDRAVDHFRALNEAIGEYVGNGKPLTYLPEIDMERSHYTVRVKIQNPPPPELSLIAGDFIQNVRASLDHLVWQLVKANGQTPSRSNAFPIHGQRPTVKNRGLERWHRQLRGVHPAAQRWIQHVQPYRRNTPSRDLLAHLARLSNEDKHRVIFQSVNAVPSPEEAQPRIDIIPVRDVGAIEQYELHAMKPLEDNSIVLEQAIEITGGNPEIDLKGEMPLDVAFGEAPIPIRGSSRFSIGQTSSSRTSPMFALGPASLLVLWCSVWKSKAIPASNPSNEGASTEKGIGVISITRTTFALPKRLRACNYYAHACDGCESDRGGLSQGGRAG